jgi:hypothetical protein
MCRAPLTCHFLHKTKCLLFIIVKLVFLTFFFVEIFNLFTFSELSSVDSYFNYAKWVDPFTHLNNICLCIYQKTILVNFLVENYTLLLV